MVRVVFMGTPEFAVPSLEALARAYSVVGVVTQPDRPAGRGRQLTQPPIRQAAERLGLPVYQPRTLNAPEALGRLADWQPDVIVAAACGHILPPNVLALPPAGCINVHASLLPRWRGAAPIAAAILAGDQVTGVTIMQMDEGIDTGPILAQRQEPILAEDTQATLARRLAPLGAALLLDVLPAILRGDVTPQSQPEDGVTFAPLIRKEDGALDWTRAAVALDRQVRAFTPWPGTFTVWRGQRLRVLAATPLPATDQEAQPGTIVALEGGAAVVTGDGLLRLDQMQLAGKRPSDGLAFIRGQRDFVGSRLGVEAHVT